MAIKTANEEERPKLIRLLIKIHWNSQLTNTKKIYTIGFPFRLKTPYLFAK